jgi:thiosulfate/3-mercaptopyruvate sulfurtransferase
LPRPTWSTLVTAQELLAHQSDPSIRLLDCRHQLTNPKWGREQYERGHLPGAVHAHIDLDLSSSPSREKGRHPLPDPVQFVAAAKRWGIDETIQVVAYDDQGGIWAARAWWLLRHYGHRAAAVLDGGMAAWLKAGGVLSTETPTIPARKFDGRPGHRATVDAQALGEGLRSQSLVALDARAAERFRGEVEPIDPVAGHIPGGRSLPAVSLLDPSQRFRPLVDLAGHLKKTIGGHAPRDVVAYCGSGVTACHLVLGFEAAGLGSIGLYPGSWSEWIGDPRRPVATGAEPPPPTDDV